MEEGVGRILKLEDCWAASSCYRDGHTQTSAETPKSWGSWLWASVLPALSISLFSFVPSKNFLPKCGWFGYLKKKSYLDITDKSIISSSNISQWLSSPGIRCFVLFSRYFSCYLSAECSWRAGEVLLFLPGLPHPRGSTECEQPRD